MLECVIVIQIVELANWDLSRTAVTGIFSVLVSSIGLHMRAVAVTEKLLLEYQLGCWAATVTG